jgi:hypothetical protein
MARSDPQARERWAAVPDDQQDVRQHCLQIINDAKQNKPSVKCLPIDGQADIEIAKILDGIIRHIEYNSHAEIVYDTATEFAVQGGHRLLARRDEYAHDGSFDQEIFIRRIKNPLTVYLDPDIESGDGSDAKFAFVFEEMTKEEFEARIRTRKRADVVFGDDGDGSEWLGKDKIRVCEYFRKTTKTDTLIASDVEGPMLLSSIAGRDRAQACRRSRSEAHGQSSRHHVVSRSPATRSSTKSRMAGPLYPDRARRWRGNRHRRQDRAQGPCAEP